ncbi:MAG: hypothetical protein FJ215_11025 [Ignavibacteria bacterium]|nr:hypothetical protein [Ignavibacteria bacterium]
MGIYPQPNDWQCGPFALKHALIMHGILVNENEISRRAGTHWWNGTDEIKLGRAARAYDCELQMVRKYDPEKARRELTSYLRRGIPSLLCIQDWSHWVTVVKEEKGQFILLDSQEPAVVKIATWGQLKHMWVFKQQDEYDEEAIHKFYDFHPVIPLFRVKTKARFSLARARYLRRSANQSFAQLWDEFVEDLLKICKPRTALSENVISLGEFFRRHELMILDQVEYWHGNIDRRAAEKILDNMHVVADTYGLVIHEEDVKRAIAGIASILTLWASSEFGVDPVYKPVKRKRK